MQHPTQLNMRKLALLLLPLLITLLANSALAQCLSLPLPSSEGFNTVGTTTFPTCWTSTVVTNNGGSTPAVTFVTSGTNATSTPFEGTRMVRFNSYNCYSGGQVRLSYGQLNTTGIPSVAVSFRWLNDNTAYTSYTDNVRVQYSLNGTTWIDASTPFNRPNGGSGTAWNQKVVTLPAAAGNQSVLYVGFLFTSDYGNNCYLDDVSITANSVSIDTDPSNTSVCINGNTLLRVAATNASSYQWQVHNGSSWANISNVSPYSGATDDTLHITGATAGLNGYLYRCIAAGNSLFDTSNAATLTVAAPAIVTAEPTNKDVCNGASTTFGITASNATSYQWQFHNGSVWANATGGVYSNGTTATLGISSASVAMNGYQYRCLVGGCTNYDDTSAVVTLSVNQPVNFTLQPHDSTACEGSIATFSVLASNGATYRWEMSYNGGLSWNPVTNGGNVSNANTSTVLIGLLPLSYNNYKLRAVCTTACTQVAISNVATLNVNPRTKISTHPATQFPCPSGNASFSVVATGTGTVTYQWQVFASGNPTWTNVTNGGVYSGANAATLSLTGVTSGMYLNNYRCIVSSDCGSLTSNTASLQVGAVTTVTTQPSPRLICESANTNFTMAGTGQGTKTYQWQESTNAGVSWTNIANGGVYGGATTAALSLTGATAGMNNYQYRCILSASCGSDTTIAASLMVNTNPAITTQPTNKTICNGDNTTFSVAATGTNLSYQWQVYDGNNLTNVTNTGIYSGATTNTLTLTGATTAVNGYSYRCVVSNTGCLSVNSNLAPLTVNGPPVVTVPPGNTTVCAGASAVFSVTASNAATFQWQERHNGSATWTNITNGGSYINANTLSLVILTATAMNSNWYRCVVSNTCGSVNSNEAQLTVNTPPIIAIHAQSRAICNGSSTMFSIGAAGTGLTFQWEVYNGTSWSNVTNTGIYSGATSSALFLTGATAAVDNYQYRCVVSGTCAPSATSNPATLSVHTPPAVTSNPANSTVCPGDNTSFTVAGTGHPLSYQWQGSMNGTTWNNLANTGAYTGVNAATLNITAAIIANTFKQYRCVLSTGCGSDVISNAATLTFNTITTITANPINKTICENGNTSFTVGAQGTNVTFQWQVSTNSGSTWANVTNTGIYSGANTFNLVLTNVPTSYTTYRYRCIVNGTCTPTLTSTTGVLTVNTNVAITSNPTPSTTFCSGGSTSFSVGSVGTGRTYRWYTYTGTSWVQVNNGGNYGGATTATLNISNMTATANAKTLLYYCRVTGTCNVQSSTVCTLTVNAKPAITANPVNVTRCDGFGNIDFKITANGTNISYQWQLSTNGGSTWGSLTNNSLYSGVNTDILSVAVASNPMNGYRYRCIVSGTCTPAVTSGVATLTVNPIITPSVAITATNTDICAGNSVKFTATPTNGGTAPTYQWRKNNTPVATGNTYTTTTLAHGDIITCHMTSNAPCATPGVTISNPITMDVTPYATTTVTILSDVGNSWCTGKPLEFISTTTNEGNSPTYTWYVNGVDQMVNAPNLQLPSISNNSTVKCEVVSSLKCFTPNPAVSNTITMTINQTTKSSIVIAPDPDSVICEKTEVTMYAAFTNAGSTPKFQWILNGSDMPGETMGTLKTTGIGNGDVINCRLISSNNCVFPEVSNPVTFQVNNLLSPDVDLITTYNGNNSYTFTAIPTNGGVNPMFEWYRNATLVPGVNGNTYTVGDLERWERIHVDMSSSEPCVEPMKTTVTSKTVTTSVGELAENISDLTLHPNPNTGAFNISGKLDANVTGKDVQIRITNALGQTVYTTSQRTGNTQLNIPVTLGDNVANGVYTVNLSVDGTSANIRFVLNR